MDKCMQPRLTSPAQARRGGVHMPAALCTASCSVPRGVPHKRDAGNGKRINEWAASPDVWECFETPQFWLFDEAQAGTRQQAQCLAATCTGTP